MVEGIFWLIMVKAKKLFTLSITAACALTFITSASYADIKNRIKYMQLGDTMIMIEAPKGKCFLEKSTAASKAVTENIEKQFIDGDKERLVAIFTDCQAVASAMTSESATPITGGEFTYITWLNPEIGYTFSGSRNAFLYKVLEDYKSKGRSGFNKLDNSIATLMRKSKKVDDKIIEDVNISAFTLIKQVPLKVSTQMVMTKFSSANQQYEELNKFINYQVNINE